MCPPPHSKRTPNGAENFQGRDDTGEAEEEPASSSETESHSQSDKNDDKSGGEEEREYASRRQP